MSYSGCFLLVHFKPMFKAHFYVNEKYTYEEQYTRLSCTVEFLDSCNYFLSFTKQLILYLTVILTGHHPTDYTA